MRAQTTKTFEQMQQRHTNKLQDVSQQLGEPQTSSLATEQRLQARVDKFKCKLKSMKVSSEPVEVCHHNSLNSAWSCTGWPLCRSALPYMGG